MGRKKKLDPPRFKVGDEVWHLGGHCNEPDKKAVVTDCINQDEPTDVLGFTDEDGVYTPGQGYRYYVEHSGQTWSVPEWALLKREGKGHPAKASKTGTRNQTVSSAILAKMPTIEFSAGGKAYEVNRDWEPSRIKIAGFPCIGLRGQGIALIYLWGRHGFITITEAGDYHCCLNSVQANQLIKEVGAEMPELLHGQVLYFFFTVASSHVFGRGSFRHLDLAIKYLEPLTGFSEAAQRGREYLMPQGRQAVPLTHNQFLGFKC